MIVKKAVESPLSGNPNVLYPTRWEKGHHNTPSPSILWRFIEYLLAFVRSSRKKRTTGDSTGREQCPSPLNKAVTGLGFKRSGLSASELDRVVDSERMTLFFYLNIFLYLCQNRVGKAN